MTREKTLIHPEEIGCEQRGFIATSAGANLDDGVAVVERVAGDDERLELLLGRGDALLQPRLLSARLIRHLGVVNENELANLRELVFVLVESGGQLDDGLQSSVLPSELGEALCFAQRCRIGERSLDLGCPSQNVGESITKRQSGASAGLLLSELLSEPLDATRRVDETLLTGEERMTLRADVRVDLRLGRSSLERIAAGALHRGRMIFGMDVVLHRNLVVRDETAAEYTRPRT